MNQRPATSRWRGSTISFGPVGRIACTVIVVLPAWWLYGANVVDLALTFQIGYLFAAIAWTIFVMPIFLRDIWKRVPDHNAPAVLILSEDRGPIPPGESILDRPAPDRW
jgi:hypothetical protein